MTQRPRGHFKRIRLHHRLQHDLPKHIYTSNKVNIFNEMFECRCKKKPKKNQVEVRSLPNCNWDFFSPQAIKSGREGATHADGPRRKTLTALLCSSVCWGQRWDLPGHNVALCTASHTLPGDTRLCQRPTGCHREISG